MEDKRTLKKVMNPLDVLVTAFGAMIGWGWVVATGDWLSLAGVLGTVAGFIIGGIMIFFVGLAYSELTTAMPECGGPLIFCQKAFGPIGAYICNWFLILSYIGVVCFEACAIPTVLQYIFPGFLKGYLYTIAGFDVYLSWLAVAIVSSVVITYINIIGVKAAVVFQTVLTLNIAFVGIILVIASAINGDVSNFQGQLFVGNDAIEIGKSIFSVAVVAPFFLFGFDVIPQVAEEINVPLKKIGKLMLLSIILAVAFYAFVVLAIGYVMTSSEVASAVKVNGLVTADAMAKAFSSSIMAKVLVIGGICGIVTSWNSFLMGGSRALFAMAESHMLPAFFAKLHSKYKTPINAILMIGLISVISVFFGASMLKWVANAASFACCVAYCMVVMAFLVIREKEPEMPRPYKVKCYRIVGYLAVILSVAMVLLYIIPGTGSTFNVQEQVIVFVWSLFGLVFALISKSKYKNKFGCSNNK